VNKDYDTLRKDWQAGRFEPIYLFYGEEDFLVDSLCAEIIEHAVPAADRDFNFDLLYGNETDGAQIVNNAASYPMMAERRLVIVKNCQMLDRPSQELIRKYAQKPAATTCLVLTAEAIDKKSPLEKLREQVTFFESKRFYENRVPDWIRSRLAGQSMTISNDAVRLLLISCGTSLRALASELEKIQINLGERKHIDAADVEKYVGLSREYNVFELCDAVGRGDIVAALKIISLMVQFGELPLAMMTMLVRHFTLLAKARELRNRQKSEADIARELHINRFFVKNYIDQAQRYGQDHLRQIFGHLLEADLQLKSSYQKPRMILELLVFKICKTSADTNPAYE